MDYIYMSIGKVEFFELSPTRSYCLYSHRIIIQYLINFLYCPACKIFHDS